MVGDVTGFGGWGNTIEAMNMKDLNPVDKKKHIAKLVKEETKEYLEWKSWCIRYNRLPLCFGNKKNTFHESFVVEDNKTIVTYLQKKNESFNIVSRDLASHVFEQIFDDNNQLISHEIKKIF